MTDPDHDGAAELSEHERAALEAWPAPTPSSDFAARVVAAAATDRRERAAAMPATPAAATPAAVRRPLVIAAAVVGVACAGALGVAVWRGVDASGDVRGELTAPARTSVALGARGVAVAEAGAVLDWQVSPAGARVQQRAGDVFYRVERGGAFEVTTPVGDVRVTGTCFRVDVGGDEMKSKHAAALGGALGLAVGAAAVITIYEGGVVVASAGQQVAGQAGDRIVVAGGPPTLVTPLAPDGALAGMSREQLVATSTSQRARITALEAEVARLRAGPPADGGKVINMSAETDDDGAPWFDPSPASLQAFADECRVRVDAPPIQGDDAFALAPADGAALGLSGPELAAINGALAKAQADFAALVRTLYVEATGNEDALDALSQSALTSEIRDKSAPGEDGRVMQRIAQERAGRVAPPDAVALAAASPLERLIRAESAMGDDFEAALAGIVGSQRARAIRAHKRGPFRMRRELAGCPDGDAADEDAAAAPGLGR
jgi:hypothetical protein